MIYDICVIGNGVLGSTLALELNKLDTNLKILILGPENKFGSASVASGAMLNVFAEIENNFLDNKYLTKRFDLDLKALDMWEKHHQSIEEQSDCKIELKWGTYVLNSSRGTKFEDRLFEYLENIFKRKSFKKYYNQIINPDDIQGLSAQAAHRSIRSIKIADGIVNSGQLLEAIDRILKSKKNITYLDDLVNKIDYKKPNIEILTDKNKFKALKIVLANGAFAQKLVDPLKDLSNNTPRLYFGAGSAVILEYNEVRNKFLNNYQNDTPDLAIRTMDRGHACGLHLLPFKSHMYLGASSAITSEPEKSPRASSMAFLLNDGMNQIGPSIGRSCVKNYTYGFRPVSEDIFPLIGETCIENIWYLNGTKRDGLTMSPYICSELAKQILFNKSDLPKEFFPSRNLISYFNKETAVFKAAVAIYNKENTHNMALPDSNNFTQYFERLRNSIEEVYNKNSIKSFGIHPELLNNYNQGIFSKKLLVDQC